MTGAPSAVPAWTSNTPGSTSYSTSINSQARTAVSRAMAQTAATSSPTKRTLSAARAVSSWLSGTRRQLPNFTWGRSAAVMTSLTPGSALALDLSMRLISACGCGLRKSAPCSMPGSLMSSV